MKAGETAAQSVRGRSAVPRCAPDRRAEAPRHRKTGIVSAGLLVGVALLAGACSLPQVQPDLTRYYLLTPTVAPAENTASAVRISLRPVDVPEYLRTPLIEVRASENEVRFMDAARWAEPLDAGLTRVIGEDLVRAGAAQLAPRGEAHDYDVVVKVRQCEGVRAGGAARLAAEIEVLTTDLDPKLVAQADFSTEVAGWDGKDFDALAKKLSEAVGRLSGKIAEMLAAAKK